MKLYVIIISCMNVQLSNDFFEYLVNVSVCHVLVSKNKMLHTKKINDASEQEKHVYQS